MSTETISQKVERLDREIYARFQARVMAEKAAQIVRPMLALCKHHVAEKHCKVCGRSK